MGTEERRVKQIQDVFAADLRRIENIINHKLRVLEARIKKLENIEEKSSEEESSTGNQ